MGRSKGLRWGSRYVFARKFREHGMPAPAQSLQTYRLGDVVEVIPNGAFLAGMPNRIYAGATGVVWNVTPHAVGILIKRRINNHIAPKRIYVRTEHIRHSHCREDFLKRAQENLKLHLDAKKKGVKLASIPKRLPAQPKAAHVVKPEAVQTIAVAPYRENW